MYRMDFEQRELVKIEFALGLLQENYKARGFTAHLEQLEQLAERFTLALEHTSSPILLEPEY